jgi:hypothetical protein
LVLQINDGDDLSIEGNGDFVFPTRLDNGVVYTVTIARQPTGQICTINNSSGILSGEDISDIEVICPLQQATVSVTAGSIKTVSFTWDDVGADYYRLLCNPDGNSGFTPLGSDLTTTRIDHELSVHLTEWEDASYLIQSCDMKDQCIDSNPVSISGLMLDTIGYLKGHETGWEDSFGRAVAISGDGLTLAVGAPSDISPATGIDGEWEFSPDYKIDAGAVYLFDKGVDGWHLGGYVKASNTGMDDQFGLAVSLSYDGQVLAVGAAGEDSAAAGIDGDQEDNSADDAGAVYLFERSEGTWQQQAYLKAADVQTDDQFGRTLSLAASGNLLSVGSAEKIHLFERVDEGWSQMGLLEGGQVDVHSGFGDVFQLSGDGTTLAVGVPGAADESGAVYLFTSDADRWTLDNTIRTHNSNGGDRFGCSLSLSEDGRLLAVGAWGEDSFAEGIDGDADSDDAENSGAVYLFTRSSDRWRQSHYIKASNSDARDRFGSRVAISGNGRFLAVSAPMERSMARGINGDQYDDRAQASPGAVYLYIRNEGDGWVQKAYVKAPDTISGWEVPICNMVCPMENDEFGASLALSREGRTLVVGAPNESSGSSSDKEDTSVPYSGAAYLY